MFFLHSMLFPTFLEQNNSGNKLFFFEIPILPTPGCDGPLWRTDFRDSPVRTGPAASASVKAQLEYEEGRQVR